MKTIDVDGMRMAFTALGEALEKEKEYLTELDAAIGDADHGINMNRGFKKVREKLAASSYDDLGAMFKDVGMILMGNVGGASGPLYGTLFMRMSTKLAGRRSLDTLSLAEAAEEGLRGVVALGKARLQEKTMVDALTPAVEVLKKSRDDGVELREALESAVEAARVGMEATIPLVARKGRASYLGERSAGHQDPGATSFHVMLSTLLRFVKENDEA